MTSKAAKRRRKKLWRGKRIAERKKREAAQKQANKNLPSLIKLQRDD